MDKPIHPESERSTRRAFITKGMTAGAVVALFPLVPVVEDAKAVCSFAYGSGLYGSACYAGTITNLLQLPPVQGNVQQDGFRFFLHGEPNRSYEVFSSSDLASWSSIGILTMPGNGSPLEILDSQTSAAARRFYRVQPW